MSALWGQLAAFALWGGAVLAERLTETLIAGLDEASRLRHEILVDPERALQRACSASAGVRPQACRLTLHWQKDDGQLAEICAEPPLSHDDLRLRPRRYFEVHLRCPAPLPGFGSLPLKIRLLR